MIALGIPSTPGGFHLRGTPHHHPPKSQDNYDLQKDPSGKTIWSLLTSAGPSTINHFCILKVVLLFLNCFCIAVKAASEDKHTVLAVGEPMLKLMDTSTPIFPISQTTPFVKIYKGKGSLINKFVGDEISISSSVNHSNTFLLESDRKFKVEFHEGITPSTYSDVHYKRIHRERFSNYDGQANNELYLRLSQSSWLKIKRRKDCDLCNKYSTKLKENSSSLVNDNYNKTYNDKIINFGNVNDSIVLEKSITNQKPTQQNRWVNFPFTLSGNQKVFPIVPSKLFYFPENRQRRRKRDTRDRLGIQEFNSQSKRNPWNGNLLQEPILLHRSSSAVRSGQGMTIGSHFRVSTDRKIFRKNNGRNVDLNNNSVKEAVEFHHLVGNTDFIHPEWTTTSFPDDDQDGGKDGQDHIPSVGGGKSDRVNASSFTPRLSADPFSISDTWQSILFARIHRDETWNKIKDSAFSGKRVPQYWFQMSEKQVDDAIQKEVFKIARPGGELWGTAPSDTENWGSSETSKAKLTTVFVSSFPRKDGVVEMEEEEDQKREKELGRETIDVGGFKPDRKGKTVFLWKDKNIQEGQKRSFKKRRQKRKIEMLDVTVVEGGLAALPCDLKVEDPKDSVQLILWIKEGIHTPLYSYDYRELLGGRPKEIRPDSNSTLSRRTTFRTDRSPAALIVERTEAEDAGIYRCRVDFLLSPTVNRRVNLTVIVPPSELRVSWQLGNSGLMEVHNREAGPFLENSQPSLVCFSDDGWPPPSLSWYEGEELLDSSYSHNAIKGQVENEIALPILTRDDLGRRLTCQASNSDKTHPTTITVNIAMTLSIISVEVEPLGVLWAGERADVECHVWGSRPPPSVVWWLGPQMIPTTQSIVLDEGNETISVLNFIPTPRDDGNMLICQATNEKLPDQAVQDSIVLSVNYAPVIEVSLGRSLNPDRIKEGDHVYFECAVKSKPPVLTVSWKHNGRPLMSGSPEQVLVANMSLVVQGVTRDHAGNYTCHATNVRNTSSSAPLRLDVKYAPVCASSEKTQYSVAKLENAEIACKVHANPSDVTFKWTFNNTAEAIDVPEGRFVVVKTESRVNYTPMNELDYGTLLCWANNTIGIQEHPCVFHIVAAGKPDPPHNCRVFDVTVSSLQIACSAGDDGGLPQNFSLKVYQIGKLSPIVKVSRLSPSFSISGLRPATAYKITIVAINDKGSSKMTELKAYTITVPETPEETNAEPARDQSQETRVPVAVAVGIAVALVPVLMMLIGVLVKSRFCGACKRRSRHVPELEGPEKASHSMDVVSTLSAEEINPDIISHTADPPAWESGQEPSISTIIPTTDQLPNGGSTAFKSAASTSSSGGAQSSLSRVSELKQQPSACMGHHHHHFHDTTCLNTSLHTHTCLTNAAAATPQVPYYTGIQQHQAVEASVPPPESFSLGCVLQPALPTSFNPLVSTLDRKRHHPSTSKLTCPHSENVNLKYVEGGQSQQPHVFFPHLYHQGTTGACSSCGVASKPPQELHCPLSRIQSSSDQATGRGVQPHHHRSQCSLSHAPGYPGQIPLPVISRASDVELVRPLGDAKNCCGSGRPNSVVLSPPLSRQIKSEDGRKQERLIKDSSLDLCSSTASSSPGHSTRESTV